MFLTYIEEDPIETLNHLFFCRGGLSNSDGALNGVSDPNKVRK